MESYRFFISMWAVAKLSDFWVGVIWSSLMCHAHVTCPCDSRLVLVDANAAWLSHVPAVSGGGEACKGAGGVEAGEESQCIIVSTAFSLYEATCQPSAGEVRHVRGWAELRQERSRSASLSAPHSRYINIVVPKVALSTYRSGFIGERRPAAAAGTRRPRRPGHRE